MSDAKSKSPLESSGMDIPNYAIERLARCLLPMMQKYYESADRKDELFEWNQAEKTVLSLN